VLLRLILYGNLWIAGAAAFLVLGVQHYFDELDNYNDSLLCFFATLFLYNAHRLIKLKQLNNKDGYRHLWIYKQRKVLFALTTLAALVSAVLVFHLPFFQIGVGTVLFIIAMVYALPLGKIPALRDVKGIKIFVVAAVWVGVCMFYVDYSELLDKQKDLLFLVLFCFIFLLTLPFDMRDVELDGFKHTSLPYLLSKKQLTFLFGFTTLLAITVLSFLFLKNHLSEVGFSVLILSFLLALLSCLYVNKKPKQHEFFYVAWVDGLIYVFALGLYLA